MAKEGGLYLASNWKNSAIQNHALPIVPIDMTTFGEIAPGPILFGAKPRAQIVAIDPNACAARRTKQTWTLVKVCKRTIPRPTFWTSSRTPSQSHKHLDTIAPDVKLPAHGRYKPILDVPHHICAQRGEPRLSPKTGRIQLCSLDRRRKTLRISTHRIMKKLITRMVTCHVLACLEDQRNDQLRPKAATRNQFCTTTMKKNHRTVRRRKSDV